jgi:release factor glutamine methyltransferase
MSSDSGVSVRDALDGARTAIAAGGSPSARLDARLLLADAMGVTTEDLLRDPDLTVEGDAIRRYQSHVRRRSVEREPVAYIVGRRAFRRLVLDVDGRVLIPRPETELLVEIGNELPNGVRVLDCCTGSGAVALAVKDERRDLKVSGSDISAEAIAVARANGERLGLKVDWFCTDLLDGIETPFDAILANPPYISTAALVTLEPEIARHEPRGALDGGTDGLAVIRRLIGAAGASAAALVAIEHGAGQARAVALVCRQAGFGEIDLRRDLAGIGRVVIARR